MTDRCTEHNRRLPCAGCIADEKAGDHDTPTDRAMRAVGVPRDRIRAILTAATSSTPDKPRDLTEPTYPRTTGAPS